MASAPTPAMVDLRLVEGNGQPTAANISKSAPDVPLELGGAHVLRKMSDGDTTVTWRELEVAVTAAVFVDRESLGANHLMLVAWSLPTISAVLTSALTLGMDTESRGSMRAALHYFVAFVREQRRSSPAEFTFSRPASFKTLPAVDVTALTPQTLWVSELQLRSGIDAGFDAVVLAVLINLLPNRYHAAGRKTTDYYGLRRRAV